jgi:hypothetical protein
MPVALFDGVTLTVEIALSAATGSYGVWDVSLWDTGTWGPDVIWTDVSEFVSNVSPISTSRKFNRDVQVWESGGASVELRNEDGRFSPANIASPYVVGGVTGIRPWRPVRIQAVYAGITHDVFRGYVIDWQEGWSRAPSGEGVATMTVQCVDELDRLAKFDGLEQAPVGEGESSGARVHRILDNAGFVGDRNIDEGRMTFAETTLASNAVTELKLAADSEGGAVFVEADGSICFEHQYSLVENTRSNTVQATFGSRDTVALIAVGAAAHGSNQSITPGLPAGVRAGHLLLTWSAIRNSGTGTVNTPDGWTSLLNFGNAKLLGRIASASESAPTITFSGGVSLATTSAQMAAFRGASSDLTTIVAHSATQLNGSAQNIAIPALTVTTDNCMVLTAAWKQDDWTSVDLRAGRVELDEPDSTLGDDQGIVWDFFFQPAAANVASSSFTVNGGASAISRAVVVALNADSTPGLPYSDAAVEYNGDQIVNIVSFARTDGEVQTVADASSRDLYEDQRHTRTDLLCQTDQQVLGLANFTLARSKDPEERVTRIVIKPRRDPTRLYPQVLGRRVRDLIRVTRRPPGGFVIAHDCHIAGIHHQFTKGDWTTIFDLWSATPYAGFSTSLWDVAVWDVAEWFY